MARKPLIGISDGVYQTNYTSDDEQMSMLRHRLNDSYVLAVIRAGGIPVILPVCDDVALMREMADRVDGVILSGGCDIDPNVYGKRPTGALGYVSPRRDAAELALAEYVLKETDKPFLGICRGLQVMNVALGGSLYIDLPSDGREAHSLTMYPRNVVSHSVEVAEGTNLARVLGGSGKHWVNSMHHQAVDRLGEGLVLAARSIPDDVIEGAELPGDRFAVGVQWHPEELRAYDDANALFRAFIEAAMD